MQPRLATHAWNNPWPMPYHSSRRLSANGQENCEDGQTPRKNAANLMITKGHTVAASVQFEHSLGVLRFGTQQARANMGQDLRYACWNLRRPGCQRAERLPSNPCRHYGRSDFELRR